jgi:hypothetical protein
MRRLAAGNTLTCLHHHKAIAATHQPYHRAVLHHAMSDKLMLYDSKLRGFTGHVEAWYGVVLLLLVVVVGTGG